MSIREIRFEFGFSLAADKEASTDVLYRYFGEVLTSAARGACSPDVAIIRPHFVIRQTDDEEKAEINKRLEMAAHARQQSDER